MKFWIGQRVKKARGVNNVGFEAVVVGTIVRSAGEFLNPFHGDISRINGPSDIQVLFDRPWESTSGHVNSASRVAWGVASLFDPIIPDGLESNEEIKALWEPSPEVVTK